VIAEDSLKVLVDQVKPWLGLGEVSTYLPELSRARSNELAVAIDLGGNGVISAGALVIVDMLPGSSPDNRAAHVLEFIRALAGNATIRVNLDTARSELMLADQNRTLA
jgi:glutaminase